MFNAKILKYDFLHSLLNTIITKYRVLNTYKCKLKIKFDFQLIII